jgi:hypothetical protein
VRGILLPCFFRQFADASELPEVDGVPGVLLPDRPSAGASELREVNRVPLICRRPAAPSSVMSARSAVALNYGSPRRDLGGSSWYVRGGVREKSSWICFRQDAICPVLPVRRWILASASVST